MCPNLTGCVDVSLFYCFIVPCGAALTGSPGSADPLLEAFIQEKLKGISREASDRNDKYRKCKQLLMVSMGF